MTAVDQVDQKTGTLIEAFRRVRQLRDKTVVVSLSQGVIDDGNALQDVLTDIQALVTVGIRPVVIHGSDRFLHDALRDAGFRIDGSVSVPVEEESIVGVVEKSLALDLNGKLADEFEKIGGRAMTLNFESTPVLTGERDEPNDRTENIVDLIPCGHVTQVDRLVISNLCYAGQVPFIPSMCLTKTGQKLLVDPDAAAIAVAEEMDAEITVVFADTQQEIDQRTARLMIVDTAQRHPLLLKMFTKTECDIEQVGV